MKMPKLPEFKMPTLPTLTIPRITFMELFGLLLLFVVILMFIGWGKNIYKLSECDFEAPYKCEVIHAVGIIPPVGGVVGWMDFGK